MIIYVWTHGMIFNLALLRQSLQGFETRLLFTYFWLLFVSVLVRVLNLCSWRIWFVIFYFCNFVGESESHSVMSDSLWPHGLCSPWNSPGQNTGLGSLCLFQEIFPTQGSNWGLLHCRQILYQLSYQGSPIYPNLDTEKKKKWNPMMIFYFSICMCVFLAALGLRCCTWAFSSWGRWGLLSSCNVRASHYSGFSCCRAGGLGMRASVVEVLWP